MCEMCVDKENSFFTSTPEAESEEILLCETTWLNLQNFMLNKVIEAER